MKKEKKGEKRNGRREQRFSSQKNAVPAVERVAYSLAVGARLSRLQPRMLLTWSSAWLSRPRHSWSSPWSSCPSPWGSVIIIVLLIIKTSINICDSNSICNTWMVGTALLCLSSHCLSSIFSLRRRRRSFLFHRHVYLRS